MISYHNISNILHILSRRYTIGTSIVVVSLTDLMSSASWSLIPSQERSILIAHWQKGQALLDDFGRHSGGGGGITSKFYSRSFRLTKYYVIRS